MIKYLTFEQVLKLHDTLIEKFGGLNGIRDTNLLLSCIENPQMSIFGKELCPTIYDKAAVYLFNYENFVVKVARNEITKEEIAYFFEQGKELR